MGAIEGDSLIQLLIHQVFTEHLLCAHFVLGAKKRIVNKTKQKSSVLMGLAQDSRQ